MITSRRLIVFALVCGMYVLIGLWTFQVNTPQVEAATVMPMPGPIQTSTAFTITLTHGEFYSNTISWILTHTNSISQLMDTIENGLDLAYSMQLQVDYWLITGAVTISGTEYATVDIIEILGDDIIYGVNWYFTLQDFIDSPLLSFIMFAFAWVTIVIVFSSLFSFYHKYVLGMVHFIGTLGLNLLKVLFFFV